MITPSVPPRLHLRVSLPPNPWTLNLGNLGLQGESMSAESDNEESESEAEVRFHPLTAHPRPYR